MELKFGDFGAYFTFKIGPELLKVEFFACSFGSPSARDIWLDRIQFHDKFSISDFSKNMKHRYNSSFAWRWELLDGTVKFAIIFCIYSYVQILEKSILVDVPVIS